ncbi:MAG: discoidin domain-containing protein [Oscillospiraceae bacterium]|nr:discoidin domain-containing protein [Oscillospiraceae bacterium]
MKKAKKLCAATLAGTLACGMVSVPPQPARAATVVTVSPTDTYAINNGVFEGWGTSLCWWANRLGYSDSLAQQAADAFYGDNGLRLNIARFNIGGGDDPSHTHITRTDSNMPGYTKYNNGTVTYDWTADFNQRNVLQRCVKAAGDDAIVEMFSNSPPYYMTNSGCSTGNTDAGTNNLRDDSYTAFAEYLAEVCKHYEQDWGIKVQSVEAMNEPYTNYWGAYSNKQEGCHFDLGDSESRIILELQKAMAARGMGDVILCGTDETSIDTQINAFNQLSADAKNAITRIDTHTYSGSKRGQLKETALAAGKNLWMSEVDGNGTAGTDAGAMAGGLWLAGRITTDCNDLNASAWILWQVIDSHISSVGYNGNKDSGMPNINGGFWGVAVADHDNDTIILSKKYYCFGQYTRYIRPGMIMLNSSGSTMAAYDKENEQLVLVAYNTAGSASEMTFDLTQFDAVGTKAAAIRTSQTENWADAGSTAIANGRLTVSLAANSVTTYIIDGVKGTTTFDSKLTPVSLTGSQSWNNTASTSYEKAFDGSVSTYFDGVGNGWVQADLGGVYDITGIGYCPRSGYEARCTDGMFMVSEDGESWTTVYTITGKPSYGMHYVRPDGGTAAARYVRYQVPDGKPNNGYNTDDVYCCNIAEIELFGVPNTIADLTRIEITSAQVTGSDPWNQSANDAKKAFDGSTATYFDGVGEGWVQADLGALYDIQAIGFCPRKGLEYRCTDGSFLISKDGVNWTTVYTINGLPAFKMQYVQDFEGDMTARYVRYQVPSGAPQNSYNTDDVYCCNIAEIELYGEWIAADTTTTATETTAPPVTNILWGDADDNGTVDVLDAVMIARVASEDTGTGISAKGKLNADVTHDSALKSDDLAKLLRYLSGKLTEDDLAIA